MATPSSPSDLKSCLVWLVKSHPNNNDQWMWGWSCVPWWGLVRKIFSSSSSRRQCDGGGRSGLFSNCDSFISSVSCLLCQPPFWGCQSRPKLVPQEAEAAKAKGSCSHYWRRHIQHTGRLVFAFLDSITGGVFFECLRLVLLTRDWFRAQSVGEYLGGMFLHMWGRL